METPQDKRAQSKSRANLKREIEDLRRRIAHHDFLYYVKNSPEISDAEYDRLFARLEKLEDENPQLVTSTSPTQRVGSEPVSSLRRVRHLGLMLSLRAVHDLANVKKLADQMRQHVEDEVTLIAEPKFDGVSVEVVYEDGEFVRASTRGDGRVGEDVSHNIKTIRALPLRLPADKGWPQELALRGEVLMHKATFHTLNKELIEQGQDTYANPRNAVAGVIRRLDPRGVARFDLDITFYDVLSATHIEPKTYCSLLRLLSSWGLKVDPHKARCSRIKEIEAFHRKLGEEREVLPFEIDGIVLKLDNLASRKRLGVRARSPRWALAWKFKPRVGETVIVDIAISVGRTGALTPVALLEPVDIGGVTVSRATLHNASEVKKKNLRVGDKVRLHRAGDVIPEIIERIGEPGRKRHTPFKMPTRCPSCGNPVKHEGPMTYCPAGLACPAQLKGRLIHYAQREAMDIKGLGEKTAEQLIQSGLVDDIADIYDITESDISELAGFAEKSARNLYAAIHNANRVPLNRFIFALGIQHVGSDTARRLARNLGTLDAIRQAAEHRIKSIPGIGEKTAKSVKTFFVVARNQDVVKRIIAHGVKVEHARRGSDGAFSGKTFVLTGALDAYTRKAATDEIERRGGRVTRSVSDKTDFVISGANPGSKLDEAKRRGIQILKGADFQRLLE